MFVSPVQPALDPSLMECDSVPSEQLSDSPDRDHHGSNCNCARPYKAYLSSRFIELCRLGKGTYGSVSLFKCKNDPCADPCPGHAIKFLSGFWCGTTSHYHYNIRNETRLQRLAAAQGIAPRLERVVALSKVERKADFNCWALWMRPVGSHTVWDALTSGETVVTALGVHRLVRELVRVLEGLQRAGIAHLDLAPNNIRIEYRANHCTKRIRLDDTEKLWVVDFGMALPVDPKENAKVLRVNESVYGGRLGSMPPERLLCYAADSAGPAFNTLLERIKAQNLPVPSMGLEHLHMADIYAAGVILHQVMTGRATCRTAADLSHLDFRFYPFDYLECPYREACVELTHTMDFHNPMYARPPMYMPQLGELIYGMVAWDVKDRWTLERIKAHPFVASEFDQLSREWVALYPDKKFV